MSPRTPAAATSSTTSSAVDTSSDRRSSPPTSRSSTGARSSRVRRASPPWSIASPSRATPSTSMPTRGDRKRSERGGTTRKSEGQNHAALHGRLHPLVHRSYLYYLYIPSIGGALAVAAVTQVVLRRWPGFVG